MAADEWLTRLRDRHDRLLVERDEYYDGEAPRGEIEGWVARHLEEGTFFDDRDRTPGESNRTIVDVWSDLVALYRTVDARTSSDEYRTRIISLLRAFEYPIPSRVLAGVVGCSKGHARRFYWDDEEHRVREKDWSRAQRNKQAPPTLVKWVRSRDRGRCLRCRNTGELVVHHVVPVGADGDAEETNLVTLCNRCHRDAHAGSISSGKVVYDGLNGFLRWVSD
jgi:hypothetical protein